LNRSTASLAKAYDDFVDHRTIGNLCSLVGKINFACSISLLLRPLASMLMGLVPHHLRIDPSHHFERADVDKPTLALIE